VPKTTPANQPAPNPAAAYTTTTPTASSPYPIDLLLETEQTLSLLFPPWDKLTKELVKRRKRYPFSIPPSQGHSRNLDLSTYTYWRARLLELYEEVYLSPPVSLMQLWRDRRDPEKFSTWIIGMMVFVLTVVITVTGVMQTWKAFEGGVGDNSTA